MKLSRFSRKIQLVTLVVLLAALAAGGAVNAGAAPKTETGETASVAQAPLAAPVSIDLCAKTGSVTMPDSAAIAIWGFAEDSGAGCAAATVGLPGPLLDVNVGDEVTVNLENYDVPENVSLVFPGQPIFPDLVGVGAGSSTSYTFTASAPGTFLYASGVNAHLQVPMGLYGALIVRPAANQAYGASTMFDVEATLVLSELDPALNNSPSISDLVNYAPKYWLINGEAYPDTVTPPISAAAGQKVLLRYLNAGLLNPSMSLLGMHQQVIARDAFALGFPYQVVAETIPAGTTTDAIATIPSGAVAGTKFWLYNRNLYVTNAGAFPGGMLAYIEVSGAPCTDAPITGLSASNDGPTALGSPTTLTAALTGGTNVAFSWDFGDSSNGAGNPVMHTYGAPGVYVAEATASNCAGSASATTTVSVLAPAAGLYLSLANNGTVGALSFSDEDILHYNGSAFAMLFDGSDVGVSALDLDAFYIVDSDSILMSFNNAAVISSLGTVDDSDIVRFDASSLGTTTSGTFSLFFDGSLVDVATDNEDVDAIELLPDGRLLVSTIGGTLVTGVVGTVQDEDILAFTPTTPGVFTSGTWAMYFDGSDVDLATTNGEDVDALDVASNGDIYLSTLDAFSVTGVSGADEDVFVCGSPTTGAETACTFSPTLYFDGSALGLGRNDVDGINLP